MSIEQLREEMESRIINYERRAVKLLTSAIIDSSNANTVDTDADIKDTIRLILCAARIQSSLDALKRIELE